MKILIVDDEKLLVKGIKFNLEQDGYTYEVAYVGRQAIYVPTPALKQNVKSGFAQTAKPLFKSILIS